MRGLIGVALGVALLGVGVVVALGQLFPETWSCPTPVTYLVAGFDAAGTRRLAVMAAAVALLVVAGALARRAWTRGNDGAFAGLLALVLAGMLALAPLYVLTAVFIRSWVYTPLEGDTGGRELIVREWTLLLGGGGEVLERDGFLLERIGRTHSDDGATPFHDGAYEVTREGDVLTVTWDFQDGAPWSMVLPAEGEPADRADGCASRDMP